jgi:hypothetical protein
VTPSATSENNLGVIRLIANLPFYRCFLRPPSTEAPSLHRSYPASSVLRASPPSQSARPFSRELPVDPYSDHCWDFPCYVWSPFACMPSHYPAGPMDLFARTFPSSSAFPVRQVGRLLHQPFKACSAFTHVTACMLAESPMRPSTPKASAASLPALLLRLLPGGANQFPGGISLPLRTSVFSRRIDAVV